MTPDSGPPLRELFDTMVELPPGAREDWLQRLDDDSARRLRAMLAADARDDGVFGTSAAAWAAQLAPEDDEADALLGSQIGGFRLVERLGQGGSSVVFRAERAVGDGVQQVALKLLRHGLFSRDAQRRFRREQGLLAQFSHPNLARLVDAGTSEAGIPWIAMELVDGLPLTDWARRHALDRDARLRLLEALALAVDAAHRALVVHRDLKPSNVLVTADGTIKVLDFGIARVLGEDAETATQQIALTPGYAAPEQYRGDAPTTAIDVYALGAIASELLLGTRLESDARLPREGDSAQQESATASHAPAVQASSRVTDGTLRERWRALDGELATILRCALAADPAQRYASARHFADDLGRFLRNEPIAAHPPTRRYRAAKFVARHRVALALGAAVLVALLVALGVVLRQRELAVQQAARADSLRDFMFDAFAEAEPGPARDGPATVLDAVHAALASSSDAADADPRARLELRLRLAQVLQRQGDLEGARALLDEVAADASRRWGDADPLAQDAAAAVVQNAMARGEFAAARAALDPLLARAANGGDAARQVELLGRSAVLATRVRDPGRALRDGAGAVALARSVGDAEMLRASLNDWAIVLLAVDQLPEAIAAHEELLVLNRARFGASHVRVANVQAALSRAYRRAGDHERAVQAARAAVDIDRAIYAGDDRHAAVNLNALMLALRAQGDLDGALLAAQEALRINRATLGEDHPDVAIALYGVGELQTLRDQPQAALAPLAEALAIDERHFGAAHWATAVVRAQLGYARALAGDGGGIVELERAIDSLQALPDPAPDHLASALEKRVRIALQRKDGADALPWLERLDTLGADAPPTRASWTGRRETLRGAALVLLQRDDDARVALQRAGDALAAATAPDAALRAEHAFLLAQVLARAGDAPGAEAALGSAREAMATLRFVPARLRELDTAATH